MLVIPTKGFPKSVKTHNINLNVLCDWIEGSILFQDDSPFISQIDVADMLLGEERYVEQDFALQGMKNAWLELSRRVQWIGPDSAIQVNKKKVQRMSDWRNYPAHIFLLLLSLAPCYDWWKETDYLEQGELFELLTEASLKAQFSDWEIYRTGWNPNKPVRLRKIAIEVAERLGEDLGDIDTWDKPQAKELGLDILCYRPFPDNRRGIPVYMMQCASGNNWDLKLHTPDLKKWTDIIHFKNEPLKAFAAPFTFQEPEYSRYARSVGGLFMERCRLLGAGRDEENWLSNSLKDRLIVWSESRIKKLLAQSK